MGGTPTHTGGGHTLTHTRGRGHSDNVGVSALRPCWGDESQEGSLVLLVDDRKSPNQTHTLNVRVQSVVSKKTLLLPLGDTRLVIQQMQLADGVGGGMF
jgi:hemolysin activation/secretion protein